MKALMNCFKATPLAVLALSAGLTMTALRAGAQMTMPASSVTQSQQKTDGAPAQDTQAQITALQEQVVKLQTALKQSHTGKSATAKRGMAAANPPMGMGDDASEMGGMAPSEGKAPMAPMAGGMDQKDAMGPPTSGMKGKGMPPKGCCGMSMGKPMPAGAGMEDDKMGGKTSGGMGPMAGKGMAGKGMAGKGMAGKGMAGKGMAGKGMAAAGTQETSPLLHLGAKDFFLDHAQHINITAEQKMQLEKLKSDSAQEEMSSQAKIDQSEQDLWQLTSADQPNAAAIDSKVQEVAKMRADEQMGFIRSVSMASNVLTADQRAQVVMPMSPSKGMNSPMAKKPMAAPMKMQ